MRVDFIRWLKALISKPSYPASEARVCTVSFTNMTDYAVIAGAMSLEDLPVFMNRYFDSHEQAIRGTGGSICRIVGDNVMALWDAEGSALAACESALDQCDVKSEFETWAKTNGYPCPQFRIGINTGLMLVHKGQRLNQVTVLGDAVNTASRLDTLNKSYGTKVLITEFTRNELDSTLVVRPVDIVRIKGKENPVTLFELIGRANEIETDYSQFIDSYSAAFSKYMDADFDTALSGFENAKNQRPSDIATDLLITRCRDLIELPPSGPWDGVFTFRVK